MELADVRDSKSRGGDTVRVRPPPPAPARRKRHIACDELFHFLAKLIARSFCCSSLSQKVTLGSPVRLQAPSQRLAVATNFLRVRGQTLFAYGRNRFALRAFCFAGDFRPRPNQIEPDRACQLVASDISIATSIFISLPSSSLTSSAAPRFPTGPAAGERLPAQRERRLPWEPPFSLGALL